MGDVVFVDVLDSEVVDDEGETDWAPVVRPISRGKFALFVAGDDESFLEELLCNNSCLGESIHSSSYFAEHVTVFVYFVVQIVFVDNVLGKEVDLHPEVFVAFHWRHQIEIFYVDGHKFCILGGYNAVEEELDGEKVCCGGSTVAGVVDQVASHRDSCWIGRFLLGSVGAYDATVGDVLASFLGNLILAFEKDGLCRGDQALHFGAK